MWSVLWQIRLIRMWLHFVKYIELCTVCIKTSLDVCRFCLDAYLSFPWLFPYSLTVVGCCIWKVTFQFCNMDVWITFFSNFFFFKRLSVCTLNAVYIQLRFRFGNNVCGAWQVMYGCTGICSEFCSFQQKLQYCSTQYFCLIIIIFYPYICMRQLI